MRIALVDVDGHNFPNLALMKLSAWHKLQGDEVEWYHGMRSNPDRIYASKVFTFSPNFMCCNNHRDKVVLGGTGYRLYADLPPEIEKIKPDLSLYNTSTAYGFLTRGCIRKCEWCVVPRKEGGLRVVSDVLTEAQGKKAVVLMDNNFLAADKTFIADQLSIAIENKIAVDFNQGLDARLVDDRNAELLAKTKWIKYIRFSCDTDNMLEHVKEAVAKLRYFGYTKEAFIYVLAKDVPSALHRIQELGNIPKVTPFCQPYRNLDGDGEIIKGIGLKRLARWCNIQAIRKTVKFEDYK